MPSSTLPFFLSFAKISGQGLDPGHIVVDLPGQCVRQIIRINGLGTLLDFFQSLLQGLELLSQTQATLHLKQLVLRPLDGIAHALAGNALILCDLRKRKVLVTPKNRAAFGSTFRRKNPAKKKLPNSWPRTPSPFLVSCAVK